MQNTKDRRRTRSLPPRPIGLPGGAKRMLPSGAPPTDDRMLLNPAKIETAIVEAFELEGDAASAVAPRLTYLQRLGFPAGTRPGRGTKSKYGIDDILKLVVTFELLELGIAPTRAARIVNTGWQTIGRALSAAVDADGIGADHARIVVIKATALTEPNAKDRAIDDPLDDVIGVFSRNGVADLLADRTMREHRLVLLDAQRIVDALVPAMANLEVTDAEEVGTEMRIFAASHRD